MNSQYVFTELQAVALRFGVRRLASRMNTSAGTLYNKLSNTESTRRHKPSLADFIEIVEHSGDIAPLLALNRRLGCAAYPLPDVSACSDEALLDLVNKVQVEAGLVHGEMSAALDDGVVTAGEFAGFDREVSAWIAAILELRARFRGLVVHAPPR